MGPVEGPDFLFALRCFQDVNETWSLCYPELYEPGQQNLYFNKKEFVKCLLHGIYNSFVLFFVPMATVFNSERNDGKDISDFQSFSIIVQTTLIWVVTVQVWPLEAGPGDGSRGRGDGEACVARKGGEGGWSTGTTFCLRLRGWGS